MQSTVLQERQTLYCQIENYIAEHTVVLLIMGLNYNSIFILQCR